MSGIAIPLVALDQAESVIVELRRTGGGPLSLCLLTSQGWRGYAVWGA